ncbi:hypothetical protein [Vibrio thalassae]|uniref:hypothetical protein n=1 Tax=Vibrio thalassae TaxID=1243014 RepID=UPI001ABFE654|nr:hypothetical protein [Vibrio thalassae]
MLAANRLVTFESKATLQITVNGCTKESTGKPGSYAETMQQLRAIADGKLATAA